MDRYIAAHCETNINAMHNTCRMAGEVKKEYGIIRKTHSKLPEYSKLNHEFEISTLEASEFLLRDIRNRITDKLSDFAKILENLINADTFIGLHEIKNFQEDSKKYTFDIFSQIMQIIRKSALLRLNEDDKDNAQFISDIFREWQDIKKPLTQLLHKVESAWKEDNNIKQKLEYFG